MFRSVKRLAAYGTALGALALGGAALADAASSSSSSSTTAATPRIHAPANFPGHGTAAHEDAEKAVTGDAATKAQAAAVKSLGGGTAGAVTTDFTGHGYEVTVTRADGTQVEVHLDGAFNVMQGPPGRGAPGHGIPGRPPGGPPPAASLPGPGA